MFGQFLAQGGGGLGSRSAHDGPDTRVARAALLGRVAETAHEVRRVLVEHASARLDAELLEIPGAGVAGADEHVEALAGAVGCADEGLERVCAQVGVQGQGVDLEVTARFQMADRVGGGRTADVTALHVPDHRDTPAARLGEDGDVGAESGKAVRFEEGDLRLHTSGIRTHQIEELDAEAGQELLDVVTGLPADLVGDLLEAGIDSDAENGLPLDATLFQAVEEGTHAVDSTREPGTAGLARRTRSTNAAKMCAPTGVR